MLNRKMISKNEINRCGEALRTNRIDPSYLTFEEKTYSLHVLEVFRRGFGYPMEKTNSGLRAMVKQLTADVVVSQRLKRIPQIIHKLERFPQTNLARLEDIGGCRVVLDNSQQIRDLLEKISKNWDVKRFHDYVTFPKLSGYRSMHVVIERDGHRIEVQLRTKGQQDWANAVEDIAAKFQIPLKDEKGPYEILEWLRLVAERIAYEDRSEIPPNELINSVDLARSLAVRWMGGGKSNG